MGRLTPPTPDLSPKHLPRAVQRLCARLHEHGHHAWLVGGCVRDSILAQWRKQATPGHWVAKDWDIATDATPERVTQIFRRVIPTGIEHGTVTVLQDGLPLEVTTLRVDAEYRDGRRPDSIQFVQTIEEDLARRDFTVNAIAFEPIDLQWVAPHGGLEDLERRCLKAVGDPAKRFAEDGLRVLRAARFVASLEFKLDAATEAAISPSLESYRQVSTERIRDEWNKAFAARKPSLAFEIMDAHDLLGITAPELQAATLPLSTILASVDAAGPSLALRLAALTASLEATPLDSSKAADKLLARLRYSNAERKSVTRLVEQQSLPLELPRGPELRRWLKKSGPELTTPLCSLARALLSAQQGDGGASNSATAQALDRFEERVAAELTTRPPLTVKQLAINGKTLMGRAGLKPGRHIGTLLESLLDFCIEDPANNTEEKLLAQVHALSPPVS